MGITSRYDCSLACMDIVLGSSVKGKDYSCSPLDFIPSRDSLMFTFAQLQVASSPDPLEAPGATPSVELRSTKQLVGR